MFSPKRFTLLAMALFAAILASFGCRQQLDATQQWRKQNEEAFASFESKPEYSKVSTDGSNAFVYMKNMKKGSGTTYPIETSRVKIHYQLFRLVGSNTFVAGNYTQETPLVLPINRGGNNMSIMGVRIALQNMVEGDEAEIIIPWHLAYGESGDSRNISPYTALRYIIRLDEIIPEETSTL